VYTQIFVQKALHTLFHINSLTRECKNRLSQSTKQKLRKEGFSDKRVLMLEDLATPLKEVGWLVQLVNDAL